MSDKKPNSQQVVMTVDEVEKLVERAVDRTFQKIGLDISNPIELQEQHQFVREFVSATKFIKAKLMGVAIVVIITAILGMTWVGFKTLMK